MSRQPAKQATRRIIGPPANLVKAQIVGAGVRLGVLARAAGISQSSLSQTIAGQRRSYRTRVEIWDAFRRLTGRPIRFEEFWLALIRQEIAA